MTAPYKIGDLIGEQYQFVKVIGEGGFGIVYLFYSLETDSFLAMKTFRDEYIRDTHTRELFKKEATIWVGLGNHPYLVQANWVDEVDGRLYIGMESIVPDDLGLISLEDHLRNRPPDFVQSLRWAIQFCYGMEYAHSKSIRCHRDIKPANILITRDKTVKISDFGLAGSFDSSSSLPEIKLNIQGNKVGLSFQTLNGAVGTPTYMSPEQFVNSAYCDERSDIYSFGIVLFQMRTHGRLPFLAPLPERNSNQDAAEFWNSMRRLHTEASVPEISSRLSPIIRRCLEKAPKKRYQSFKELRIDLARILKAETGEIIKEPKLNEFEAWEWHNKGMSLAHLGFPEKAITCFDKAIDLNISYSRTWFNKGTCLDCLGYFKQAIACYDNAIALDPHYAKALYNKGSALNDLARYKEAITCFDKALEIKSDYEKAWCNKGFSLQSLGHFEEAIHCYDKSLDLDPSATSTWYKKAQCFSKMNHLDHAIHCYQRMVELEPSNVIACRWKKP